MKFNAVSFCLTLENYTVCNRNWLTSGLHPSKQYNKLSKSQIVQLTCIFICMYLCQKAEQFLSFYFKGRLSASF